VVAIEELDADAVRDRSGELARLLLDAHASGMALGLAAPLTTEGAQEAYVRAAERLEPGERILLAALDGDELVGAVQLDRAQAPNGRHRAELRRLVVRDDRRGAGIGRALVEAAVDRARAAGLLLVWLTTHDGTVADRFYERLGWTRSGVIEDWARLPDGTLTGNAFFYLRL